MFVSEYLLRRLQSFRATYDLEYLFGNGGLACAVVREAQLLQQFAGVFCCLVHGRHAGAVLGGI